MKNELLLELANCLEEAHQPNRNIKVNGRNHGGDGAQDCSYCLIIKEAREAAKIIPIIAVEGGIIQDVFYPVPSGTQPYTAIEHDLIDYDMFKEDPEEDIAAAWAGKEQTTREYIRKHCPDEYKRFQTAVRRARTKKAR